MSPWLIGVLLVVGFVAGWIARGSDESRSMFIPPRSPAELEAQIRSLLLQGQKLRAIKIYREFHRDVDLRHAKEIVEAMERGLMLPPS